VAVLARSGHSFTLPDRCLVGRSRACDLVVTARDVSGQHAVLQWTGLHWQLQDLGSRNGTHVDDVAVVVGEVVVALSLPHAAPDRAAASAHAAATRETGADLMSAPPPRQPGPGQ